MVSDEDATLPQWLDEKEKDNFNNFTKVVKASSSINFNDGKWKKWFQER